MFLCVQGSLSRLVPVDIVSHGVALLHMGLLYALYAFEYKWFNMGKNTIQPKFKSTNKFSV